MMIRARATISAPSLGEITQQSIREAIARTFEIPPASIVEWRADGPWERRSTFRIGDRNLYIADHVASIDTDLIKETP